MARSGRAVLHVFFWLVWPARGSVQGRTNRIRSHHAVMGRPHLTSPKASNVKPQFCILTNQNRTHHRDMRDAMPPHMTPACATMSANPLARDEMTEIQANGNTPRRSWQTVVAEGVTEKLGLVSRSLTGFTRPSGIRLTRSLRAAGGRVNVSGRAAIAHEASRSFA